LWQQSATTTKKRTPKGNCDNSQQQQNEKKKTPEGNCDLPAGSRGHTGSHSVRSLHDEELEDVHPRDPKELEDAGTDCVRSCASQGGWRGLQLHCWWAPILKRHMSACAPPSASCSRTQSHNFDTSTPRHLLRHLLSCF